MGYLARRETTESPSPFSGESFERTRALLKAGREADVLTYNTNVDRLELRAIEIKALEVLESQYKLSKEASYEVLDLLKEVRAVLQQTSDPLERAVLERFAGYTVTNLANSLTQIIEIAKREQAYVLGRSVSRRY